MTDSALFARETLTFPGPGHHGLVRLKEPIFLPLVERWDDGMQYLAFYNEAQQCISWWPFKPPFADALVVVNHGAEQIATHVCAGTQIGESLRWNVRAVISGLPAHV